MKSNLIIPQKKPSSNRKVTLSGQPTLFPLPNSKQEKNEPKFYLQISSVPIAERINPNENRYILVVQPQGVRAAAGQYTADEAYEIARATKNWDWSLDPNNRPQCLPALEALLTSIVKRPTQDQGGAKC